MKSQIKTDPKLLELIRVSVERVKSMTPEELEAMLKAQAASWVRQDMD
jgi:hypothetical protein